MDTHMVIRKKSWVCRGTMHTYGGVARAHLIPFQPKKACQPNDV